MGGALAFLFVTLGFAVIGFLASVCVRVSYNKGPAINQLNFVLVVTTVICAWMMWAIVYLAQWKPLVNPILSES